MVIALDCSASALENDYRPSRLEATSSAVQKFIVDYYDQNPISQLAIILSRDRTAEKCSDLSGNARSHVDHLRRVHHAHDLASLESCILLAMKMLRHIPNYGHKELLIVFNSLSSCDAGDIFQTVQKAKNAKLRISVIATSAEVFICRQIAELTGGTFSVAMDGLHLAELLQKHTVPPADLLSVQDSQASIQTEFIRMGFPRLSFSDHRLLGYEGKHLGRFAVGYHCPRCYTRASDIPTKCAVCQLQLNSSSHIARSFHHLFPVPAYIEYQVKYMPRTTLLSKFLSVKQESGGIAVKTEPGERDAPGSFFQPLPTDLFVAERVAVVLETYYTDDEEEEEKEKETEKEDGSADQETKDPLASNTNPSSDPSEQIEASKKRRRTQPEHDTVRSAYVVLCSPSALASQDPAAKSLTSSSSSSVRSVTNEDMEVSLGSNQCHGCASALHSAATQISSHTKQQQQQQRDKGEDINSVVSLDKIVFQCPRCHHLFCIDCDIFIHDVLHNCPGCPL
jgi:transcription factor Ssl1